MSIIGIIVAAVLGLSAASIAVYAWLSMGSVAMSTGGYFALGLGAGLMGLVFYSNRKGYDDAAGARPDRDPK